MEVGEGMLLDVLGVSAELVAVEKGGIAPAVAGHEGAGKPYQGCLQRRVRQGLVGGAKEVVVLVACVSAHADIVQRARFQATGAVPFYLTSSPAPAPGAAPAPCCRAAANSRQCS